MAYKKTKSTTSSTPATASPGRAASKGSTVPRGIIGPERKIMTRNGIVKNSTGPGSNSEIAEALSDLMNEGYTFANKIQGDIIRDSEILLNDLGFIPVEAEEIDPHSSIVVEFSKDFSLLKTTNVDTTIKNSKILDPDLDTLTPEPIKATEKFKSESDPFYELDDEKPESDKQIEREQKRAAQKKLVKVAVKLTSSARRSRNKMLPKKPFRGAIK
jgi:hypothetical protein